MRTALPILIALIIVGTLTWFSFYYEYSDVVVQQKNVDNIKTEEPIALETIVLTKKTATTSDGTEFVFNVDKHFDIAIVAEGLGKARFMSMSPDGRLFVPDMINYNLSHEGRLLVLEDFNEKTKQFETKHTYLSGLRGPNSIAFYTDKNGKEWLYVALTEHLLRYPYNAGDVEPSAEPEIVYKFPNEQSPGEVSVVWHITRTLLFHDNELYISVGSGCNACEELSGSMRAMIIVMNPDGTNAHMYADGLRNTVGIEWANPSDDDTGGSLYATANGVDHLGTQAPDEPLYKITEGAHYGWPYCYELNGESVFDASRTWDDPLSCEDTPRPLTVFSPRSAPLGLEFFHDAHPVLNNTFLVALHGSFEKETRSGYEIVRVTLDGEKEIFMDGFQLENNSRIARPVDIMQVDKNSFFFTDDFGGRIFYVYTQENG